MGWLMCFFVLNLAIASVTISALRQSVKTNAFTLPALNAGDRLISVFVVSTFTVASIYGLASLAAKVLP